MKNDSFCVRLECFLSPLPPWGITKKRMINDASCKWVDEKMGRGKAGKGESDGCIRNNLKLDRGKTQERKRASPEK